MGHSMCCNNFNFFSTFRWLSCNLYGITSSSPLAVSSASYYSLWEHTSGSWCSRCIFLENNETVFSVFYWFSYYCYRSSVLFFSPIFTTCSKCFVREYLETYCWWLSFVLYFWNFFVMMCRHWSLLDKVYMVHI